MKSIANEWQSPVDIGSTWDWCWHGLGARGDGAALMAQLLQAYAEPQRHYHTVQHLAECLGWWAQYRVHARAPAEVGMALWFHDAVYDVQASDNEQQSADWARTALQAAGVAPPAIDNVVAHILATRHSVVPQGPDQQLLLDIDLSILGAPRPRFAAYETQVRAEYAWVPPDVFRHKRSAVLAAFLARDTLYHTPALHAVLEAPARQNLAWSLAQLGA